MFPHLNPGRNLHVDSLCMFGDYQTGESLCFSPNDEGTFNKHPISLVPLVDSQFLLNGARVTPVDLKKAIATGKTH